MFLSYGRSDRGAAFRVAQRLDAEGFSVWWDPKIAPGVTYDRVIERALVQADCVVVLWSAHAVESDWVRAESDEGRRRGILVPVLIEDVQPPLQFRLIETIDLTGWLADPESNDFDRRARCRRPPRAAARSHGPLARGARRRAGHGPPPVRPAVQLGVGGPLRPARAWPPSPPVTARSAATRCRAWRSRARSTPTAVRSGRCAGGPQAVASGGTDGTIRIWDPWTLAPRRVLEGHQAWVLACALARDGSTLVSGARDGSVCVWDLGSGALQTVLAGHRGAVWSAVLFEDSRRLVTSSDDQTLRVWSLPDGRCLSVLRGHTAPVMACALLPDGEHALSAGYDKTVRRWDLRNAKELDRLEGSPDWILSLAHDAGRHPGHRRHQRRARCWRGTSPRASWSLRSPIHQGPVMSLDFRADTGLLSASADKTVALLSRAPLR